MNNFLPSLSPDAIDLSLCAMVVGDSDHNQAEATGISEKQDTTIIHYHRQASDNDEFLSWYGKLKKTFRLVRTFDSALRKWKEILLEDLPSSLDLAAISNFCTRGKFLFLKSRPQDGLRIV